MNEIFDLKKDPFHVIINKLESMLQGKYVIGYIDPEGNALVDYGSELEDMEAVYLIDMLDKTRAFDDFQ